MHPYYMPPDAIDINSVDGADYITTDKQGNLVVRGFNQSGYDCVDINIKQLIDWIKNNKPELLGD